MRPYGYQHVEPAPEDYIFGDSQLGDSSIQPSGNWDNFLPVYEGQNRGFEPFCCVSEAVTHCIEILQRKKFEDATDYSVRFLAKQSGTRERGGNDANTVSETLRKQGCCQESDWPFGAKDFDTFYSQIPEKIIRLAKLQFADNSIGHSWVTDMKPGVLMSALTYSPMALAVFAWPEPDKDNIYHRPPGSAVNHCVTVYGYEYGKYWKIWDSYEGGYKKLAWDYEFGIGKRFTLDRRIPTQPTPDNTGWVRWDVWIQWIRDHWLQGKSLGATRSPEWPEVQKEFLALNPSCAACGTNGKLLNPLNVHHIEPFHINSALELDKNNLITLCRRCHFLIGHLLSWKSWNKDVAEDSKLLLTKVINRP